MPTIKITFVQAIYVLATFVHISNISDFDKTFGSKFFGGLDFSVTNYFENNFSTMNIQKNVLSKNNWVQKEIFDLKRNLVLKNLNNFEHYFQAINIKNTVEFLVK